MSCRYACVMEEFEAGGSHCGLGLRVCVKGEGKSAVENDYVL